jgi:hypothetical protein
MAGKGSWLASGQYLAVGDYLAAPNGQYFAVMQSDGNFVIYQGSDPDHQGAFAWNSATVSSAAGGPAGADPAPAP